MLNRLVVFLLLLLLNSTYIYARNADKYNLSTDTVVNRLAGTKRVYIATRIEKCPEIDGKLSDLCWKSGVWSGEFIQQVPDQGKKPSQETEINILYDNNNLYVGFKYFEKGPVNYFLWPEIEKLLL